MAISVGTVAKQKYNVPARTTDTLSCTQPAGSGGYLFVITYCDSSTSGVSSVDFNGVLLTQINSQTTTISNQLIQVWRLANPSSGTHDITVSYVTNMYNPTYIAGYPITGSSGEGVFGFTDTGPSPKTTTLSVSQGSIIIAPCADSGDGTGETITIDSVLETLDFQDVLNNWLFGAHSSALNSGNRVVSAASNGQPAAYGFEVKMAAATATSKNTQFVWF
jgi:hypothetical protein